MVYSSYSIYLGSLPKPGNLFGHLFGIVGFGMMLATETLYSLRKRSRSARLGRMSAWLQFHIFTGIVGPWMVLLHTSFKFNGLAGAVTLLTIIVVFSGFVGRYIYTAVPRTADGRILEIGQLEGHINNIHQELTAFSDTEPSLSQYSKPSSLTSQSSNLSSILMLFGRAFDDLRYQINSWMQAARSNPSDKARHRKLRKLLDRQRILERQISSIAAARRALSIWHTVHVPIGVALFITATIHIGAAIYYSTLLR